MSRATGEKAKLRYDIVERQIPNTDRTALYPEIKDRDDPVTLAQVIAHAIDTGGICDQMYQEFLEGDAVKFGDYFTARLYLKGSVDSKTARVTGNDNVKLNVRLSQGTAFRMNKDDFTWTSVDDENAPFIENVMSATGTRGEIAKNNPFDIDGRNFGTLRSAIAVKAYYEVEGTQHTVDITVTGVGENRVSCGFPSELAQVPVGTELKIVVTKTVDEVDYSSNSKKCKLAEDPSEARSPPPRSDCGAVECCQCENVANTNYQLTIGNTGIGNTGNIQQVYRRKT